MCFLVLQNIDKRGATIGRNVSDQKAATLDGLHSAWKAWMMASL